MKRLRCHPQLIQFIQDEFAVPEQAIAMALKYSEQDNAPFHMILWQYGLISLEQLGQIFDWLLDHSRVVHIQHRSLENFLC